MITRLADPTCAPDLLAGATIPDLLAAAAAERGDDPYLRMGADALSIHELWIAVGDAQRQLAAYGVRPRSRVAVMLPNHIDHVILILALIGLRAEWVPVNTKLRGAPLAHQVTTSRPELIIVDRVQADQVRAASGRMSPGAVLHWDAGHPAPWRRPASGTPAGAVSDAATEPRPGRERDVHLGDDRASPRGCRSPTGCCWPPRWGLSSPAMRRTAT